LINGHALSMWRWNGMKAARALVVFVLTLVYSAGARSQAVYFNQPLLVFTMTATVSRVLTTICVKSRAQGNFTCLPGGYAAFPTADYRLRYHVRNEVTEIKANPTLVIEPCGVAKFTISLIPIATGVCGSWDSAASVFATFDDGTVLSSRKERIS